MYAASSPPPPDPRHPAEIGLDLGAAFSSQSTAGSAGVFEDWNIDDTLRTVEDRLNEPTRRRTSRPNSSNKPSAAPNQTAADREPYWRIDGAHAAMPKPHVTRRSRSAKPARTSGGLARGVLWLGFLALLAGAGVTFYGMLEDRLDLWNLGVPTLVSGTAAFLLGLVLQLEHIRRNSRQAVARLKQLDSHLAELERTTALLTVTQGGTSQAFYAHLAEQASPNLLLADLKGQIDLLSLKLGKRPAV